MKAVKILFCCHLAALVFGLAGLLIAMPHPELWSQIPNGADIFSFGIMYAGSLHILLGAATLLLFGLLFVGVRKTVIFFVASTLISLCMELLGTSTGFPFGPYAYSDFLGFKILGHVPFSIPLSWFYMGFSSLLLAHVLVARSGWSHRTLWSLLGGVYFLTVWDLSLDPAMANAHLPVHFWVWYQNGPYFGMPISNLAGWSVTGLIYMSVSRLLWGENPTLQRGVSWLPFGVYAANTVFAIVLNLNAGLWLPPLIGLILGLLPASLVLLPPAPRGFGVLREGMKILSALSHLVVRRGGQILLRRHARLFVTGKEHIPVAGPVVIAARHYHHLYDGCALLSSVPRRLHILVALDWIERRWQRWLMEFVCKLVTWPVVLRSERLEMGQSIYSEREAARYLRRALRDAGEILRRGEVLALFPEGYPVIDPLPTPSRDASGFLPFRPGFIRLVEQLEREQRMQVAIVPAGFSYEYRRGTWLVTLRFGPALFRQDFPDGSHLLEAVEARVRALSAPASSFVTLQKEALEL